MHACFKVNLFYVGCVYTYIMQNTVYLTNVINDVKSKLI